MRYQIFVFLLATLCGAQRASSLSWHNNILNVTLPRYVIGFQNEIKFVMGKGNVVEIHMPKKSPRYWLEPKNIDSDEKMTSLFFGSGAYDCKKIMAAIKAEYPHLKSLYESPSYITDGYSLETHTLNVLEQFSKQKEFYPLNKVDCSHVTDAIERLLIATIFVHDVGKPLGARFKQHENTVPIARYALKRWGFSCKEIDLAIALINNDILGELAQEEKFKQITIEDAHRDMQRLAEAASLTIKDYVAIQTLFFVSDASSYLWIRNGAFKENKTGFLWPKSKRLNAFYNHLYFREIG